jgi:uncharacterized protein (UPF0276 family)
MPEIPRLHGAGLGFRRDLIPELLTALKSGLPQAIEFFELAPENWIDMGGRHARDLRQFTERHTFVCHGLSLSLGGMTPLDEVLLRKIKAFMGRAPDAPLYRASVLLFRPRSPV